jgi:mono/diheme cytochrome c family protein
MTIISHDMTWSIKWLIVAVSIVGFGSPASAQDDVGKLQYQVSCAACHGAGAKGDGPVSKELKTPPADLTVLAKNNNGVFPYDRVYQIIDGRHSTIANHGTRKMPKHAHAFKARILAVINYLKTVQEK